VVAFVAVVVVAVVLVKVVPVVVVAVLVVVLHVPQRPGHCSLRTSPKMSCVHNSS
jgi:hypothetical protein